MKTRLTTVFFLVALCSFLHGEGAPKATIEKSNSDILPTPYRIYVDFNGDVPESKINKKMFSIEEKQSGDNVSIISVRNRGAIDPQKLDPMISGVLLDADIDPHLDYLVRVSLPNGVITNLNASAFEKAINTNAIQPLINLNARSFKLEVNPFDADGDQGIGLKYDVRYDVKDMHFESSLLRIELQTHGEFSMTSSNNSQSTIQNSLNGGLSVTYLHNVPAALPLGSETRAYVYPMGFKIAPAEFEANKDFTVVNYTAKVLVGGAVPYADYPALLWSDVFKLDVPFFAPTLFTGFTALSDLKDDGTDQLSKLGHTRWDTEFLYYLPLHRRLDFKFSWNWYVGMEKSFWANNCEAGAILYVDDKRTQGFTLSYQDGALPPEFTHTRSWRIGYTAKF